MVTKPNFKIGDKVMYENRIYKVVYVYGDGKLKLRGKYGKTTDVLYHVPPHFVTLCKEELNG